MEFGRMRLRFPIECDRCDATIPRRRDFLAIILDRPGYEGNVALCGRCGVGTATMDEEEFIAHVGLRDQRAETVH